MEALVNKLVLHVANKNNSSEAVAARFIDKCLMKISTEENIDYNEIYRLFYTFSGLATCLAKSCSTADIQECEKLCHCVIFKNKCVPRYLPEAPEINEDPDKWLIGMSTDKLKELVEYVSYLYYNYDGGGLTDNSFDALEYTLNKRLKLKGRRWEKIGAEPVEKLRAKLPYPMPSLEKIKPGMNALLKFLSNAPETGMVWSEKLDGVSAMIIYRDSKIEGIYTRGDGETGGNITYMKDYLKLPSVKGDLVVRGELVLTKETWTEKYKGTYANARSFVSAKVNSGFISPAFVDIDFVAYSLIDHKSPPSQAFKILQERGFKTPSHGTFPKGELLVFTVMTRYKSQREGSQYYIDGLVLSTDVTDFESKAFKMTLEEQLRSTKIINVEWRITRYGRYFPVAIYESVYVDGVRLHKASAHNAQHISDWHMGKGTKIVVARSGDVIPVIKDVTINEDIDAIFPDEKYEWYWSGKDILLKDVEGNPEVHVKRISYFFETIGVPQVGEGRVKKLYDSGMTTLKSITSAGIADFKKLKGFGPKLSTTIYNNIHNTMKKTRLDRYFVAVTTLRSSIGRKTLKTVIRHYPKILTAEKDEIQAHFKKNKIPGIGPAKIKGLVEGVPKFRAEIMELNKDDISFALKYEEDRLKNIQYNSKIKGKLFVTTGFLDKPDYELEDYIWDHWGELVSTVTSNTTAVISANVANITGKMLKANELGVPVYSIEEFLKAFDVPIRSHSLTELVIAED